MDGDDIPWNNDDGDDYGADMAGFDGQEDEAPVDEPTPIVTEPSLTKSATTKARRPRTFKQPRRLRAELRLFLIL